MKRRTEELTIELGYVVGQQDPARGVFRGGVADPHFLDQLTLWVARGERFDGSDAAHLSGSAQGYAEIGRHFVALSRYRTLDPAYHDHFDELRTGDEVRPCSLIVKGSPDHGDAPQTLDREVVTISLRYFEDDRGGPLDASGVQPPEFSSELFVWWDEDGDRDQLYVSGTRRALRGLGCYFIAMSRAQLPSSYFDTLDETKAPAGQQRAVLVVAAPSNEKAT
jgi:hypothetical protein